MALSPIRKLLGHHNIGASELICLFPEYAEPYHDSEIELVARKWALAGDKTFAKIIGLEIPDDDENGDDDENDGNKYTRAGELQEPVTAAVFVRDFPKIERLHFKGRGRKIVSRVALKDVRKTYDKGKGLIVTPDRLIFPKPLSHHVGIECKFTRFNPGDKHGNPDEGGIPAPATMIQVCGQMDFFEANIWFAGVSVAAVDYFFYRIDRNFNVNRLIEEIRARAAKFVEVLRRKNWETLTVDDSKIWRKMIHTRYPKPRGESEMIADSELQQLWEQWQEASRVHKEAKEKFTAIKNAVELKMCGNHYVVDDLGNRMFNRYSVKESVREMKVSQHCRVAIAGVKKNGKQ